MRRRTMLELASVVTMTVALVAVAARWLGGSERAGFQEGSLGEKVRGDASGPTATFELPLGTFAHVLGGVGQGQADDAGPPSRVEFEAFAVFHSTGDQVLRAYDRMQTHRYRIREVVESRARSLDQEDWEDPSLETLRASLHEGLGEFFGDDLGFEDVAVTRILQYPHE